MNESCNRMEVENNTSLSFPHLSLRRFLGLEHYGNSLSWSQLITIWCFHWASMVAFHGCYANPNHLFPRHPFHIATHQHLFLQDLSPSFPHTPYTFVHSAQSLGIDFESTRTHLLGLFGIERTLPPLSPILHPKMERNFHVDVADSIMDRIVGSSDLGIIK